VLVSTSVLRMIVSRYIPSVTGTVFSSYLSRFSRISTSLPLCSTSTFSTGATKGLSPAANEALNKIKDHLDTKKKRKIQLSKKEARRLEGNSRRYRLKGDRPEFHNIDRNKNGHIIEPTDTFRIVITSSKNNCWIMVQNMARDYRTVFGSHAGNVGIRKCKQMEPEATYRIAQNIARKCKRLGVTHAEVRFRRLMKVDVCLQAFQAHGLNVSSLTHVPLLPKTRQPKPRERRRV